MIFWAAVGDLNWVDSSVRLIAGVGVGREAAEGGGGRGERGVFYSIIGMPSTGTAW